MSAVDYRPALSQLRTALSLMLHDIDCSGIFPVPFDQDAMALNGPGVTWTPVKEWTLQVPDNDRHTYVTVPQQCVYPTDVTPLTPTEARHLAHALLSAARRAETNGDTTGL